jgi:thymidylate synthase
MERYWPKYASGNNPPSTDVDDWRHHPHLKKNRGIRNEYGDLNDLVKKLAANPLSRQEWFPIFHPEDVGDVVGGRKPCSLGYQFWVRDNRLHCYYPLRSCDFMHHMRDDIYMTIRLMLWVIERCKLLYGISEEQGFDEYDSWSQVKLGTLTMHCTSLHVFTNDFQLMRKMGPLTNEVKGTTP